MLATFGPLHTWNPRLFFLSVHGNSVCLQWLVGNVVGRDDTLYARMKQRELDGHDTMWEPIFVDDAAIGLGDQKNKVLQKSNKIKLLLFIKHIKGTFNFKQYYWFSLLQICSISSNCPLLKCSIYNNSSGLVGAIP